MRKIVFVLSLFAILITSCGGNKDNATVLNLGVMPSMDYLPLLVAQREGYFEKEGLNIKIQKFYSANDRDAAFQSGSIDGAVIDYTGAVLQKSGGIDLKLTSKCDAPFYVVASKSSGVDSISGLKGKKVAVSQNTVIDYCVDMALNSAGLTSADIEKVEINKIPLRFEMLQNDKIDATGLPNPFALMAESSGCKIVTSNADLGFSITGIVFTGKAIESKTEMIRKMYLVYNQGVEYLASHSVVDIQDILVKDMGFSPDVVAKATLPVYTKAVLPSDKDIQSVVDWLAGRDLVDASFDKSQLLDGQFVK